jgi:hypothetical protein
MPNFDAGRYFLTVLAPIRSGDENGVSHRHSLRTALDLLPTALQSPATRKIGLNSPFSRNLRTHLARFAVIDDVVFNGASPIDPILGRINGRDPINPGLSDGLATAYLMFTAETDAVLQDGAPLPATLTPSEQDAVRDSYAGRLWETMADDLRGIFRHCHGFETVDSAESFAHYIARAQVETTMPFNDYYTSPPVLPLLPIKAIAAVVLVPLAVLLLALLGWLVGAHSVPVISLIADWRPGPALFWAFAATVAALALVYTYILMQGAKPLPPATDASLPEVLKALHLQRQFTAFAEGHQVLDATELHAAFGRFLDRNRPLEAQPTQVPGVISSPIVPLTGEG